MSEWPTPITIKIAVRRSAPCLTRNPTIHGGIWFGGGRPQALEIPIWRCMLLILKSKNRRPSDIHNPHASRPSEDVHPEKCWDLRLRRRALLFQSGDVCLLKGEVSVRPMRRRADWRASCSVVPESEDELSGDQIEEAIDASLSRHIWRV